VLRKIPVMKKVLPLVVVCLVFTTICSAQRIDRSKFLKDSLDYYINRALTNWRIPGAAVCIVKDNKVVMMKAYGIKELGQADKVGINSLFMIGSNTKAFTATALAILQTQNKLSLDDKVTKYLPKFRLDDRPAGDMAIIKDLLSHRLGFKTFEGDFTFYNTDLTREQIIERLGKMKAAYPFRTKWGYTNSAFLTAGQIIPVVTGKPWETFIKENIFAPLGMINTIALTADMQKQYDRTVPHTLVDGRLSPIPYAQLDGLAPAGAISSCINDMSKWVLALLNDGKVGARQMIPAAAIKATREPQDLVGPVHHLNGEEDYELYGLGWFLEDYAGRHLVMHTGGVNGYLSSVTLVPQEHLGIIVLTNTDQNDLFEALKWEVLDAYFKMPFRNYSDVYLTKFKAEEALDDSLNKRRRDTVALNHPTALPLTEYTGKYVNDFYGHMEITTGEANDLEMRFEHHTHMFAHLQPLGGNRFYVVFSDPTLGKAVFPFYVQNGKVTGVKVKVADFVEYDPYEFRKE
jgi:CubicO group peptidase (beta-lactamase class C family)